MERKKRVKYSRETEIYDELLKKSRENTEYLGGVLRRKIERLCGDRVYEVWGLVEEYGRKACENEGVLEEVKIYEVTFRVLEEVMAYLKEKSGSCGDIEGDLAGRREIYGSGKREEKEKKGFTERKIKEYIKSREECRILCGQVEHYVGKLRDYRTGMTAIEVTGILEGAVNKITDEIMSRRNVLMLKHSKQDFRKKGKNIKEKKAK